MNGFVSKLVHSKFHLELKDKSEFLLLISYMVAYDTSHFEKRVHCWLQGQKFEGRQVVEGLTHPSHNLKEIINLCFT